MDFDNLQSVTSGVSDTLPFGAISITGRDCFWDRSVPNPLLSVGSPTMSVSSSMPEPSGAGARVGVLRAQFRQDQGWVYQPCPLLPILFLDQ